MSVDDQVELQKQLVENVLSDPNATDESKLIALMGRRQLDMMALIVEIRSDHKKLEGRVESLEQAGVSRSNGQHA